VAYLRWLSSAALDADCHLADVVAGRLPRGRPTVRQPSIVSSNHEDMPAGKLEASIPPTNDILRD
jgi:hypothetical protein